MESDGIQYLYEAITQFNQGANGRKCLFDYCDLNTSYGALNSLQKLDKIRLYQAAVKVTDEYKQRRKTLRVLRKGKGKKRKSDYIPGAFSTKSVPDIHFERDIIEHVEIKFVHDDDVEFLIHHHVK